MTGSQYFRKNSLYILGLLLLAVVIPSGFGLYMIEQRIQEMRGVRSGATLIQKLFELESVIVLHGKEKNESAQAAQNIFREAQHIEAEIASNEPLSLHTVRSKWNELLRTANESLHRELIHDISQLQEYLFERIGLYPYPTNQSVLLINMFEENVQPLFEKLIDLSLSIQENENALHRTKPDYSNITTTLNYCSEMLVTRAHRVPLFLEFESHEQADITNKQIMNKLILLIRDIKQNIEKTSILSSSETQELSGICSQAIVTSIAFSKSLVADIEKITSAEEHRLHTLFITLCLGECAMILLAFIVFYIRSQSVHKTIIEQSYALQELKKIEEEERQHQKILQDHAEKLLASFASSKELLDTSVVQAEAVQEHVSSSHKAFDIIHTMLQNTLQPLQKIENQLLKLHENRGKLLAAYDTADATLAQMSLLSINGALEVEKSEIIGTNLSSLFTQIKQLISQVDTLVKGSSTSLEQEKLQLSQAITAFQQHTTTASEALQSLHQVDNQSRELDTALPRLVNTLHAAKHTIHTPGSSRFTETLQRINACIQKKQTILESR